MLAAGRGSRLAALTEHTHKSLLPVAGKPVLRYVMDEVFARGIDDVVIVTGDKRAAIERFVSEYYPGRVRLAHNERFAADTNILSTEIGVSALRNPDRGYLIVETDLVVEPAGWASILDTEADRESFWVTRGTYGTSLTGGALQADASGQVTGLVYAPRYDAGYEGWQKLLGVLYVGSNQVAMDRELRRDGIAQTIAQYYMTPWVEHLARLPCRAKPLGDYYAASFNDLETYRRIDEQFTTVVGRPGRAV